MRESHQHASLTRSSLALVFALAVAGAVSTARAHTSLPAYLELKETTPGSFDMLWRVPAAEGPPPAIYPVFPTHCVVPKQLAAEDAPGSVVERGVIECGSKGLAGDTIEIDNLQVTILDVLVRITFADGTSVTQILRPLAPSFVVHKDGRSRIDTLGYVRLGIGHILYGIDHLLFVLGLLLIVPGVRMLLDDLSS